MVKTPFTRRAEYVHPSALAARGPDKERSAVTPRFRVTHEPPTPQTCADPGHDLGAPKEMADPMIAVNAPPPEIAVRHRHGPAP